MRVSLIGEWTDEIGGSRTVQGDTATLAFAFNF
jgi:hypothetical protein